MPALLILLLVTSLVGGGTAYASQDALPGDPLYMAKMLVEDTRLLINADEIGDAELHLEFATERLEEAAALVAQGRPDFVEDLMAEYGAEMDAALAPLGDGVDDEDLLATLAEALNHHQTVLASLLAELPEEAHESAIEAIQRAIAASDVASHVLETVGGAVDHEPPTIEPPTIEPPAIEPPPVDVEPPPVDVEPPPVDVEPPPVDVEPPPVDVEPPPVDVEPPPVDVEPPPVDVEPPPVDVEPPPVDDVEPPPVDVEPPAVDDVEPPAEIPGPPGETPGLL